MIALARIARQMCQSCIRHSVSLCVQRVAHTNPCGRHDSACAAWSTDANERKSRVCGSKRRYGVSPERYRDERRIEKVETHYERGNDGIVEVIGRCLYMVSVWGFKWGWDSE